MNENNHTSPDRAWWRGLEGAAGPEPPPPDPLESPSRRRFLELMGASVALAGATACRWPAQNIVPFASRPEGRVPGVPAQYATAMELGGVARPVLATSYDGRPIKIEGNPDHPQSLGATDALAQAAILELYDPDRFRTPLRREGAQPIAQTWDDFHRFTLIHFHALAAEGGKGFHVLSEAASSPTLLDLRARLGEKLPQMKWHEYEAVSRDNEHEGTRLLFGVPYLTRLALEPADVIVSLDADFLMNDPASVRLAREFAGRRRAEDGRMSRLYVVESAYSITGAAADHRLPALSKNVAAIACRLGARLRELGLRFMPTAPELYEAFDQGKTAPVDDAFVEAMARDLMDHRGRCLVVAGPGQPPQVHALAHLFNSALEAAGTTVLYSPDPDRDRPSHVEAIRALADAMEKGEATTLLILGGNPAYDAPADLDFAKRLANVPTSIHLSLYANETSQACKWNAPRAHWLESWGDSRAADGTLSVVQPLIAPLYDGRAPIEILAFALTGKLTKGYDLVRATFKNWSKAADFELAWRSALDAGMIAATTWPTERPMARLIEWAPALRDLAAQTSAPDDRNPEITFRADYRLYDGRFANNGWLQELPDPMTRVVWDNPALVAPATAQALGVRTGDVIRLRVGDRQLEAPVFVAPGQARGSISLALGHGRRSCGRVGDGVGVDANALRTTGAMHFASAAVERTDKSWQVVSTQDHHAIDPLSHPRFGQGETQRRLGAIVREATLDEFVAQPDFAKRIGAGEGKAPELWTPHQYTGRRWGMAIDLAACIGCGA
ncbi:MAG: molybdopterin oxidoreductase, partial [Candidatus Sumerlaeota bacterium]|nr:molybdopterin oxidoreductase [Candidatus Sumerlaeota bacterium]